VTDSTRRTARAAQRQQTETRILAAARQLFAERGYERTTIRAVAAAAGVDAGLVMHYFGSKKRLFTRAAKLAPDELATGTAEELAESLLDALRRRLDDEPVASLALLRSMLTHPDAAAGYRHAAESWLEQIQDAIPGPDADLRASLVGAIVQGVVVQRYLLRLGRLADAPPDAIIEVLRPCFQALVSGPHARPKSSVPA
jgi:AcrR family transcriptional regulator